MDKSAGSNDPREFVTLQVLGSLPEAASRVGLLRSKGIECSIETDKFGQLKLKVKEADVSAAIDALDLVNSEFTLDTTLADEPMEQTVDDSEEQQNSTTGRKSPSTSLTTLVRIVVLLFLLGLGSWVFSSVEFIVVVVFCLIVALAVTLPILNRGAIPFLATCILPMIWLRSIDGLAGLKKWLIILDCCVWIILLPFIRGWVPNFKPLFADWDFKKQMIRATQCLLVVVWLGISVANRISPDPPIRIDPARSDAAVCSTVGHRKIGLALSGGGYRAAIFHAGVLSALEHFGLTPTHLSSVSGGSIIASYYVMGGDPNVFPKLVKEGRFRLLRRLTYADQALTVIPSFLTRNWFLGNRTTAQADLLNDTFLQKATLGNLRTKSGPKWIICTTDLLHGWGIGLFDEGIIIHPLLREGERLPFKNVPAGKGFDRPVLVRAAEQMTSASIARLVAASGAFPLAFDAVPVIGLGAPLLLSDGGVSDNTGLSLLLDAHLLSTARTVRTIADPELEELVQLLAHTEEKPLASWKLDTLISSDAGLPFREQASIGFASQLGQALDTLFANGSLPPALTANAPPAVILSPTDLVNYDFAPTQSEFVRLHGNPTNDEITAAFLGMRASGISRKDRLIGLALAVDPETKVFIEETLLASDHDGDVGIARSRNEQIAMILGKLHDQGELKDLNAVDGSFLDSVCFTYEKYMNSFLSTGTLEDNIKDQFVDDIFRLGQMTVALNLQALRSANKQ